MANNPIINNNSNQIHHHVNPGMAAAGPPVLPPINPLALAEYQQRLQLFYFAQQAALRMRLSQAAAMHEVMTAASSSTPGGSSSPVNTVMGSSSPVFDTSQSRVNQMNHVLESQMNPVFGISPHPALEAAAFPPLNPFARFDPRFRFMHEEPKPQHSYIGLIAMAILSTPEHKMVLADIYQYILDNYPYFRNRGPGWRNSIRHNLSLNDCFVKSGRSANGKGHYWAIHPANLEDFIKGDFRRRKAQRKVRRHMGLSVPDDDDSNSPTPSPAPALPHMHHHHIPPQFLCRPDVVASNLTDFPLAFLRRASSSMMSQQQQCSTPKRTFDVESLLSPDT